MSEDEVFALIVASLTGLVVWGSWYVCGLIRCLHVRNRSRTVFLAAPPACAALLFLVLRTLAAHDVRDSVPYLLFYLLLGAAWVGVAAGWMRFLGLNPRDDVVERQNPAAAFALTGALLGLTLCFAGANIGDGPGWWVVVFSALLSTAGFYLVWALFEVVTHSSEAVTVERDPAAGLRLAGFLTAAGLILGRAVAGDWITARATAEDFVTVGWPALALLAAAVLIEIALRPAPGRPAESGVSGALPALVYIAGAALYVLAWQAPP